MRFDQFFRGPFQGAIVSFVRALVSLFKIPRGLYRAVSRATTQATSESDKESMSFPEQISSEEMEGFQSEEETQSPPVTYAETGAAKALLPAHFLGDTKEALKYKALLATRMELDLTSHTRELGQIKNECGIFFREFINFGLKLLYPERFAEKIARANAAVNYYIQSASVEKTEKQFNAIKIARGEGALGADTPAKTYFKVDPSGTIDCQVLHELPDDATKKGALELLLNALVEDDALRRLIANYGIEEQRIMMELVEPNDANRFAFRDSDGNVWYPPFGSGGVPEKTFTFHPDGSASVVTTIYPTQLIKHDPNDPNRSMMELIDEDFMRLDAKEVACVLSTHFAAEVTVTDGRVSSLSHSAAIMADEARFVVVAKEGVSMPPQTLSAASPADLGLCDALKMPKPTMPGIEASGKEVAFRETAQVIERSAAGPSIPTETSDVTSAVSSPAMGGPKDELTKR